MFFCLKKIVYSIFLARRINMSLTIFRHLSIGILIISSLASCSHIRKNLHTNIKKNDRRLAAVATPEIISIDKVGSNEMQIIWGEGFLEGSNPFNKFAILFDGTKWADVNTDQDISTVNGKRRYSKKFAVDVNRTYKVEIQARNTDYNDYSAKICKLVRLSDGTNNDCTNQGLESSVPLNNNSAATTTSPATTQFISNDNSTAPQGYILMFQDEFNQPSGGSENLNRQLWNTQLRWDGDYNGSWYEYRVINKERQFYLNPFSDHEAMKNAVLMHGDPFEFTGSTLKIKARKNSAFNKSNRGEIESFLNKGHGQLNEVFMYQPFLSGALSTYDKFYTTYGYYEARIKLPNVKGTFPAFWLHHQKRKSEGSRRTEIDIMENIGNPQRLYATYHQIVGGQGPMNRYVNGQVVKNLHGEPGEYILDENGQLKPTSQTKPKRGGERVGEIYDEEGFNGFHVYAVDWSPERIIWYYDGIEVGRLENWSLPDPITDENGNVVQENSQNNIGNEELYIILNLAMGGSWLSGSPYAGGIGYPFPYQPDSSQPYSDYDNFQETAMEIDWVRAWCKSEHCPNR